MRFCLTLLTVVFFIIFTAPRASAQRGRLFTPDNELSSSLINHIMQDSEGYVWVATEYGLNRTDGTGFTIYHHDPDDPESVKSNYVRTVYENRSHSLRVGCINGLMEFDRANDSFVEIPMFNRGERVYPHVASMIELSNGELWIATLGNGVFRLDPDGRQAVRLDDVTRAIGSDYVTCMHEDTYHCLWIGTENSGLCRYFPASGTARAYHADELPGNKISAITEDAQGNIYAGILDHGGVVAYNRAADTFAPACDHAIGYPVQDVAIDSDGSSILMAVDGSGLKIIRNNTIADYPLDTPNIDIANSKVHHILIDRDENLWLGIFQRGVYLSPCSRFRFNYMGQHQTINPIGKGCVMMVKVDSRSDVWVSCDNDGLYRVYSVTGQCMAHIPMTATVLSMVEDGMGRMWAGTYGGGLALVDPATSRVTYIPSLAGTRIYGLAIDGDGNILAATLGDGVFSYNPATGETRRFRAVTGGGSAGPDVVTRDWVNGIMIDRGGNVWLATFSGVCRLDPSSGAIIPVSPLTGTIAYTLAENHDGTICVGTVEGMMRYNPLTGENTVISVADGMPNDVICSIVEDAANNLWVSTYHGIARYTPSTGAVTTYDAGDGLQGNEFTHGAYCTTPNGTVYFGGTHGVTSFHPYDIEENVRDVMQPFELFAQENDITLSFIPSGEHIPAWIDLNNFDKVLMNLLSNAFKYTPAGGTITVSLSTGNDPVARPPLDDYVQIVVSDSGIGIPPEEIDRIFERFYRVENTVTQSSFGTGIGLHLAKSLIMLHHGTINVHNRHDGPGCEFVVRIPRGSDHLTAAELAAPDSKQPVITNIKRSLTSSGINERPGEPLPSAGQRPRGRIMVAEDNPEIRAYISRELGDTYTIVVFTNGREALDAVLTETPVPDLIISDIMMPGMDGITLTRKIKKGINTNHIPVILLSARSSAEEMKEGLESGADNYMVKPFNTEVLKMTIANLLATRHLLKVKYSGSQEQEDKVEKIEIKSQDEILMRKIMAVVNARISSPDLSVESLAAEVGISRVHLNRRLKEITNQSARDFIRNIRMRQAARLLHEKKLSITEVAYATGFANPSHFSVAFKEIFGITPRAYAAGDDRLQQD